MLLKKREFTIWSISVLGYLFCGIYLLAKVGGHENYAAIAWLPFVFALCSIVFANVYTQLGNNIGLLCLHCLMIIRLIITPIFMTQANFRSIYIGLDRKAVDQAVLLLSYECVIVYFVLSRFAARSRKQLLASRLETKEFSINYQKPSAVFTLALFAMALYCLAVWVLIPNCRDFYKTVFDFSAEDFTTALYSTAEEETGTVTRAALTLFKMAFDVVRLLLPMYFLIFLKRRGAPLRMSITIGLLLAAIQFFFIDSTTAKSIICAFLLISFLARLYPAQSKKIVSTAAISVSVIIAVYFSIRFAVGSRYGDDSTEYVSKILNAYFAGIDNVAAGTRLPAGHESATFWGGLYSAIPFNSTLFGLRVKHLQTLFNDINGSYGQIPPMLTEGYYYFGTLFAPVLSGLYAALTYHFGEKFGRTNSAWYLVSDLFATVLFAIAIVMYNQEIALSWLTSWLIPLGLMSLLADKEKVK